jgi:hypothetical protein
MTQGSTSETPKKSVVELLDALETSLFHARTNTTTDFGSVHALERRPDRAGETPSTLLMPNGTTVASTDPGFLAAATREILRLHASAAS